jgi:preprotein translocase subunit SecA
MITQKFELDADVSTVRGLELPELEQWIRDAGERQGLTWIQEQLDIHLPEDAESRLDWNWLSLTRWANRTFGLSLNDRELRSLERGAVADFLLEQAKTGIARWDLSDFSGLLEELYPERSLAAWANYNFLLGLKPEELRGLDEAGVVRLLKERVQVRYNEKEATFPVSVGMHKFLAGDGQQNERARRETLARWAATRFRLELNPEEFADYQTNKIFEVLLGISRSFLARRPTAAAVDARLNDILGDTPQQRSLSESQTGALLAWFETELGLGLNAERIQSLSVAQVRTEILQGIDQVFRPELRHTERSILLEFLDTAWKEHLYFMGHLRQGIGFVGYAQQDPRTEYKREGRRAFLSMWERIAEQVTQTVFRVEHESPDFVSSLWRITATEHDVAPPADNRIDELQTNAPEAGEEGRTVKPIVNAGPRIGRNDDCPCGSGKKYKKCCGR